MNPRFSCVTQGVREFLLKFLMSGVALFSVCGVFLDA